MKTLAIATFCLTLSFVGILNANDPANDPANNPTTPAVEPTPVVKVPHCEVPCGIYGDQLRFEQMLEDTVTIAKAIAQINEMAASMTDAPPTGKTINQVTRWVSTKETHATNIQHTVAQYFLTQRIKSDHKDYVGQLATAHNVMVAAMKCKQDSDPATADALKQAIYKLYEAYEGKKPNFESGK